MFNDILITFKFPDKLRIADVKTTKKNHEATNVANYRPVRVLPAVSKISERYNNNSLIMWKNIYLKTYVVLGQGTVPNIVYQLCLKH